MKSTCVLAAGLLITFGAAAAPLPEGWRSPTAGELEDRMRADSSSRYSKAVADFNGDGVKDTALIVKSTRYRGEGLLVHLSNEKGGFTWRTLSETEWGTEHPDQGPAMGVDVVPAGEHDYMCVEKGKECVDEGDGKSPFKTDHDAVGYFRMGSASSFFYWSKKQKAFVRVWTSD
jgi:hypothetical protein